jgi:hypothetical protein
VSVMYICMYQSCLDAAFLESVSWDGWIACLNQRSAALSLTNAPFDSCRASSTADEEEHWCSSQATATSTTGVSFR